MSRDICDKIRIVSRRKWLYSDRLDMSIFLFVESGKEENIYNIINNIEFFSKNKNNDINIISTIDLSIFKNMKNINYFRVDGKFDPETISCFLAKKNIIIGISSNILVNNNFFHYIDKNIFDDKFLFNIDDNNSILFVVSSNILANKIFYSDSFFGRFITKKIPFGCFDICPYAFKKKSYLDFIIFDKDGKKFDLYNNKIIKSMWIGNNLSNVEKVCIYSFLDQGHDFHLYVYDDIKGIPDGVVVKDANSIIDEKKIFKYKKMKNKTGDEIGNEGFAGFSDWFRYVLLYKKGGWWSDLDSLCLKNFNILRPYFFPSRLGEGDWFTNGVFKTVENSLVMSYCIQKCEEIGEDVNWMQTGPNLLHSGYVHHSLRNFSITSEIFDLDYSKKDLIKEHEENIYSLHIYNSRLVRAGKDKNGKFSNNKLFKKLKNKYL